MIPRSTWARVALGVPLILVALGGAGAMYLVHARDARLHTTFTVHTVDFPVPTPLSDAEIEAFKAERRAALSTRALEDAFTAGAPPSEVAAPEAAPDPLAGVDLAAVARERAVARGRHLVESRYVCTACHGADFGGGTMIDAPAMGKILGRNLTSGKGGVVANYTVATWDAMVRHGVKPDGTATIMPSEDFKAMSDQELADIITYISSLPPVDREVPPPTFGPIGTMLVATGQIKLSAEFLPHDTAHAAVPPAATDTLAYGEHITQVCKGCHGSALAGGPIVGGDPAWLPAANLTPHADGLASWTFEDFTKVMKEGVKKDGQKAGMPMSEVLPFSSRLGDEELAAMWAYLRSVTPLPDPT